MEKLTSLLVDPENETDLALANGMMESEDGKIKFPLTGDIPWLYSDPFTSLSEWKSRFDFQDAHINKQIENIKFFQKGRDASEQSKKRVNKLLQAQIEQQKLLRKLMTPLGAAYSQNSMLHEAIKTKLPSTQTLMSYYSNIFRDWSWGDNENELSAEIVCSPLKDLKPKNMLVLGAGAGRLAVDVHKILGSELCIMADINPFLVFCGKKMIDGESLRLYEFPIAPLTENDVAIHQKLS